MGFSFSWKSFQNAFRGWLPNFQFEFLWISKSWNTEKVVSQIPRKNLFSQEYNSSFMNFTVTLTQRIAWFSTLWSCESKLLSFHTVIKESKRLNFTSYLVNCVALRNFMCSDFTGFLNFLFSWIKNNFFKWRIGGKFACMMHLLLSPKNFFDQVWSLLIDYLTSNIKATKTTSEG